MSANFSIWRGICTPCQSVHRYYVSYLSLGGSYCLWMMQELVSAILLREIFFENVENNVQKLYMLNP